MAQEEVFLWAEIKKHEDTLAKDPLSYSFAPLAELYRKVGLLDEAIDVARKGCGHHPEFVGGFMALGRAYFEKGMKNESREAIERVISVNPDNSLALKLLSQLYLEIGENQLAEKVLLSLLVLNPDDMESNLLLKSLSREEDGYLAGPADNLPLPASTEGNMSDDTDSSAIDMADLDEIEVVEELTEELLDDGLIVDEFIDDDEDYFATELPEVHPPAVIADSRQKDPLTTVTLAELYVSQGFIPSALKIYQELLSADPENQEYLDRCEELQTIQVVENVAHIGDAPTGFVADTDPPEADESVSEMLVDQMSPETDENNVTAELELWLNNIRRMRGVI